MANPLMSNDADARVDFAKELLAKVSTALPLDDLRSSLVLEGIMLAWALTDDHDIDGLKKHFEEQINYALTPDERKIVLERNNALFEMIDALESAWKQKQLLTDIDDLIQHLQSIHR